MRKIVFEEVQRFRDNAWVWPLLAVMTLAMFLPVGAGMYQQMVLGEPWGQEPMSDLHMVFLLMFLILCWLIAMFMMLSMTLHTRIDEEGIHFRLYPLKPSWRIVNFSDISDVRFQEQYGFFDRMGVGHNHNLFTRKRSFKIWGGKHIAIEMKDGSRILLGTQKLGEMEWALKRLKAETK